MVAGHSVGEIVAAAVAGVFSLADAARLVCARGRLMQGLAAGGGMLSVEAPESDVVEALVRLGLRSSVSAVNGPRSVVVSGELSELESLERELSTRSVRSKRLKVSHGFHSHLVEPMLESFRGEAESVSYGRATVPVVSNVTGALGTESLSTAEYWVRHVRQAVRFADGVSTLQSMGVRVFVELGPQATLVGLVGGVRGCGVGRTAHLASLRSGRSESTSILEGLGSWVVGGWGGVVGGGVPAGAAVVCRFRRTRGSGLATWIDRRWMGSRSTGSSTSHPLLGVRTSSPGADGVYELMLTSSEPSWLGEHQVGGRVVVAAAMFAEWMRAAGEEQQPGTSWQVRSLVLQQPLVVAERSGQRVQVVLTEGCSRVTRVYSQASDARVDAGSGCFTRARAPACGLGADVGVPGPCVAAKKRG